jgi:hypothetical protein
MTQSENKNPWKTSKEEKEKQKNTPKRGVVGGEKKGTLGEASVLSCWSWSEGGCLSCDD